MSVGFTMLGARPRPSTPMALSKTISHARLDTFTATSEQQIELLECDVHTVLVGSPLHLSVLFNRDFSFLICFGLVLQQPPTIIPCQADLLLTSLTIWNTCSSQGAPS